MTAPPGSSLPRGPLALLLAAAAAGAAFATAVVFVPAGDSLPPGSAAAVAAPDRAVAGGCVAPIAPDGSWGEAMPGRVAVSPPDVARGDGLPVVVRGCITHLGALVPRADLSFFRAGAAPPGPASDWCVADRHGHYEVELPPGCYVVRSADLPDREVQLTIAAGAASVTADLRWRD